MCVSVPVCVCVCVSVCVCVMRWMILDILSRQHYDEELSYIPQQFAPLSNIHKERLPKHCIYEQPQKVQHACVAHS